MDLATTAVFYAVIGVAVAVAQFLTSDLPSPAERCLQVASAWLFWPLYLPLLLRKRRGEEPAGNRPIANHLDPAIIQVERELEVAWTSLDGWAEEALSREADRLVELRIAWRAQAERISELDQLLANSTIASRDVFEPLSGGSDRARQSTMARQENLDRLRTLRQHMADDLAGTLAWVRELATMIHVAKFTGAPASRAEDLVSQIAAAIEGLREVHKWHDPTTAPNGASLAAR